MGKEWIEVGRRQELPPGRMKRVELEQHRYLIINAEGQIYAVDDQCSHEDVSLYLGCIQGKNIKCPLHGSRFSLKTGEPLEDPATDPIATYPVKIEDDKILIETNNHLKQQFS
jgi:3-phenylpropionate/trans-cinnamate dioxygenase ferredoxin subunit